MRTRTLVDHFVSEVDDLQLWRNLSAQTMEELRALWSSHPVVVFRRQAMSETELIEFGRVFGQMERSVRTEWSSPAAPEISLISNLRDSKSRVIGGLGDGELQWHSDQSYILSPATGAMLYAVELPPEGGATSWLDLYAVYDAMDERLRQVLSAKWGVFDYTKRLGYYDQKDRVLSDEARKRTPPVRHPLVHRHPVSGRKALYLDIGTMSHIDGMDEESSRKLLDELYELADDPRFIYRHVWQVGDLIMWDNGVTMHRRDPFDSDSRRLMKRTTLFLPSARHIVPSGELVNG